MTPVARFLIHIHSGPAAPNTVTLGAFIAATAAAEGHAVTLFLAGDAVACLAPDTLPRLEGLGTGRLADHLRALGRAGGTLRVSRLSSEARGLTPDLLQDLGLPASFAAPTDLVALAAEADTVLCY